MPGIGTLLKPASFIDGVFRVLRRRYPNLLVDRKVRSADWESITRDLSEIDFCACQITTEELQVWVKQYYPNYQEQFGDLRHKKLLEFFISFKLLQPRANQVFMDAAGGANGYLARLDCKRKILQDIRISATTRKILGSGVEYIECDAGALPLDNESVDRISCHHSFEHFQGDADMGFIKEVQRILTPGGRCCIVPIFLADRYAEITDKLTTRLRFDPASVRIIDPTATIPGTEFSGNFARVYDIAAFRRRLLSKIDLKAFKVEINSLTFDGGPLPDRSLPCHRNVTAVNFPYRALVIEKIVP